MHIPPITGGTFAESLAQTDHESRRDTVIMHAWNATIYRSGIEDDWKETLKIVQDAVNNAYCDGMSDDEWYVVTMRALDGVVS